MRPAIAVIAGRRRRRGGLRVVVSDTFTRANNASSLGSAETGQVWAQVVGTGWGIDTNQAALSASVGNDLAVVDSGVSVCSVAATLTGVTGNNAGLAFSVTDASNWWGLWGGSGGLFLIKNAAGVQTVPASDAVAIAEGSVLKVTRSGASITCAVNGVVRLTLSDAFNASATKHGLGIGGADVNHRWDNFLVTVP